MKALSTIVLLGLSIMLASCGNQSSTQSASSQFDNFVNANDGIEFKAASLITTNQINNNNQNINSGLDQAEILLTLDHNGTFHMRSSVPANLGLSYTELEGIRGKWELDDRRLLVLSDNSGATIAQASYSFNQTDSKSFALTIQKNIDLEIMQVGANQNYNNYNGNFTSYGITNYTLQGLATVERD